MGGSGFCVGVLCRVCMAVHIDTHTLSHVFNCAHTRRNSRVVSAPTLEAAAATSCAVLPPPITKTRLPLASSWASVKSRPGRRVPLYACTSYQCGCCGGVSGLCAGCGGSIHAHMHTHIHVNTCTQLKTNACKNSHQKPIVVVLLLLFLLLVAHLE